MPVVELRVIDEHAKLGIWKIEEQPEFFMSKFNLTTFDREEIERISASLKLLQWLASRYLLKLIVDTDEIIYLLKDDFGKPYIEDFPGHISISHCNDHVAVIVSKTKQSGVDIEKFDQRIERISHRFLKKWELHLLDGDDSKFEKLVLYWSAKETLYKWYGRKGLTFKTQLLIQPFEIESKGTLRGKIVKDRFEQEFDIPYFKMESFILTYVLTDPVR